MFKIRNLRIFYLLLGIWGLFSVYLLGSGSDLLLWPLLSTPFFPFGTLVAWSLLSLIPFFSWLAFRFISRKYSSSSRHSYIGYLFYSSIAVGLIWGIVSFLLAGNWSYSFRGNDVRSKSWMVFTIITAAYPFVIWIMYGLGALILLRIRKEKAKNQNGKKS